MTGKTDYEAATSHLQEALRSFREVGEDHGVAHMTNFLGMIALRRGEPGRAERMFEEGLEVARRIGDRNSANIALYNLERVMNSRAVGALA